MGNTSQCIVASNSLYGEVQFRPELKDRVIFAVNNSEGYTFRLKFVRPEGSVSGIYGMSISFPPDAYGNRGEKNGEGFPSTIETALLGTIPLGDSGDPDIHKADLLYDDDAGYYDVRRFSNADEWVEEIIRVANCLLPSVEG